MNYDTPIQFYLRTDVPGKKPVDKLVHRCMGNFTRLGVETLIKQYGDVTQARASLRLMNPLHLTEKQFTYFVAEGIKYSVEMKDLTYIRGVEF